jgi:hypothetical protein
MATGLYSWSQTAATNSTADSTINWAEGQAPSTVNDSARALMAVVAKWRDDISGTAPSNVVLTTGGTANAQTLSTNGSIAALTNGWTVTFKAGATNTGACTLAVDSLTAKNIQRISGTNLLGGEIISGYVYTVTYHQPADTWVLHNGAMTPLAGSWTPAAAFGGASVGVTYGTQVGRYVLHAPLVSVWGRIVLTADGSSSGDMTITGLPYAASTVSGLNYAMDIGPVLNSVSLGGHPWKGHIASAASAITIYRGSAVDGNSMTNATELDVGDTLDISFAGTYRTG